MAVELTEENFDITIKNNGLVLVDFWAEWCGPCRMLAPTIAELSDEIDYAIIAKVNADIAPGVCTAQGVRALPTLKIYKNGTEVDSITGAVPKQTIVDLLNKHR